jgi:ElaB/YqjD/DUF883 family membrane-anchored ribosome-binding protein
MKSVGTGLRLGCIGLVLVLAAGCEESERRQLSEDVDAVIDDVGEAVESGAQELREQVDQGAREVRRQVDEVTDRVQEEVDAHRGEPSREAE